jgi:hypothetical protein
MAAVRRRCEGDVRSTLAPLHRLQEWERREDVVHLCGIRKTARAAGPPR